MPILGGGKRDRTADLLVANQTLSQLSYTPVALSAAFAARFTDLVGLERFELSTPRLSSVCSNQLSYRPSFACKAETFSGPIDPARVQKPTLLSVN